MRPRRCRVPSNAGRSGGLGPRGVEEMDNWPYGGAITGFNGSSNIAVGVHDADRQTYEETDTQTDATRRQSGQSYRTV